MTEAAGFEARNAGVRGYIRGSRSLALSVGLALISHACASIPKGQYGVDEIAWRGVDQMEEEAIESCLVTRERERVAPRLGIESPSCGKPPFDSVAPRIVLWTLPWTDWPVYDPAIFEVEKERIQRWYRARGYYDARVLSVKTYVDDKEVDAEDCRGSGSDCELKIVVHVSEGQAIRVSDVNIVSTVTLPADLHARLRARVQLRAGERFDEAVYDADKEGLAERLRGAAYARARVSGRVVLDRAKRSALVEYRLEPGPQCVFGELEVEGAQDVPASLIVQAAAIPAGKPFNPETLDDAQRAIFALGVFSSVKLETPGERATVDVRAVVQRGRVVRWGAGLGVMSGTLRRETSEEITSIPQWDVHLKGSYENRNFLGGLRRLRIEERPHLIMLAEFPRVEGRERMIGTQTFPARGPQPGNVVSLRFEQPGTFEARTKLVTAAAWDFGPDPFLGFFRHDISAKIGFERPFWRQRLLARIALEHDLYDVTERAALVPMGISDYKLPFLEQSLVVDLRDNQLRPKLGAYLSVTVQEASQLGGYGAWDYVRVVPDVRGYVPLVWDVVLAARFALGALFVFDASDKLDPLSARLGPQTYRLRGGGVNSNRGFIAGQLGDSATGGTRRWEGSLELRAPIGGDFGVTFFGDVGDVFGDVDNPRRTTAFRFKRLNTSLGIGLRYFSILGALRLDAAWRVPGWQLIGDKPPESDMQEPLKPSVLPTAVHLTIGEAF